MSDVASLDSVDEECNEPIGVYALVQDDTGIYAGRITLNEAIPASDHLANDDDINFQPSQSHNSDVGIAHLHNIEYWDQEQRKWLVVRNSREAGFEALPRSNFGVITWNIDFATSQHLQRTDAAISYLRSILVTNAEEPDTISPTIILFQEVDELMLLQLAEHEWVRKNFYMTDTHPEGGAWARSHYNTVSLIDRRIMVKNVIRLHYDSQYGRDCLFVDIIAARGLNSEIVTVRLGNTHLESLRATPPKRPAQLKMASKFILSDNTVHTGLIAGDMNPIEPFDRTLHSELGLKDAYLERGGAEEDPEGHTWGYQSGNTPYRPQRFDKVLYAADNRLRVEGFSVIGAGQKTQELPKVFISDHYGVWADVRIL